jgi:hypothetical protein
VRVQPVGFATLDSAEAGGPDSIAPKSLAVIRDLVARVAANEELRAEIDADVRVAARLLGWVEIRERPIVTEAGARLLASEPGSADEIATFAAAVLEHPPLCSIVGALVLGEWLELRDLGPALARTFALPTAQAARLVPCILAWRNDLRAAGWTARDAALHLRSRTAWMKSLSVRTRDVLARLGVLTREAVRALDLAALRERAEIRPETIREIERFLEEIGGGPPPTRGPTLVEEASVLLRKIGSFELGARARRVLRDAGAVCMADVVALDPETLLQQPQCGRSTVDEILRLVHSLGLRMAERAAPPPEVRPEEPPSESVIARARRLGARRGCVSIGALARECADLPEAGGDLDALRGALDADPDVRWIDDDRAWFWFATERGAGLLARVDELLREGGLVAPAELRHELLRDAGARSDVPPTAVLAALCEQLGYGERLRFDPVAVDVVQPAANAPTTTIDGNSSVAELAAAAGLTVDELVALAVSDAGRETGTGRGGRRSRR